LRGKKPNQIPYISEWSELAVGPFWRTTWRADGTKGRGIQVNKHWKW
jgi:hypothetical protein